MDLDTPDEVPSIIEEIVFYDKPNIKKILPGSEKLQGKGDLIYSRAKQLSSHFIKHTENSKISGSTNSPTINLHRNDISLDEGSVSFYQIGETSTTVRSEKALEEHSELFIDSSEYSDKHHSFKEEFKEAVVSESLQTSGESASVTNQSIEPNENINCLETVEQTHSNIELLKEPEEISNEKPKETLKLLISTNDGASELNLSFKKLRGRPRRVDRSPQKSNLANFVTVTKKPKIDNSVKTFLCDTAEKASGIVEILPEKVESKQKKNDALKKSSGTDDSLKAGSKFGKSKSKLRSKSKKSSEESETKKSIEINIKKSPRSSSSSKEYVGKKPRGRPRKSVKQNNNSETDQCGSTHCYSDDENSFMSPVRRNKFDIDDFKADVEIDKNNEANSIPKKTRCKRRTLEITGTDITCTDDLENLLDEAHKQVETLDKVEEQLKKIFQGNSDSVNTEESAEQKIINKSLTSSNLRQFNELSLRSNSLPNVRKTYSRKNNRDNGTGKQQKISQRLEKKIKKENKSNGKSEEPLVISDGEGDPADYDSDTDSRKEWVPEEYAEYKQKHLMKLLKVKKVFECKNCLVEFRSYYSLRKHRAVEHNDAGTERGRKKHSEESAVPLEIQSTNNDDDDSDGESRSEWMPEDYAEYKIKHNMKKLKKPSNYRCKICCAVFSNYYKMSNHKAEHANKVNPYECKQCDANFSDVDSLTAHIRIHQGKDPYQCKKCDKGFMTKEELEQHTPVHILKKNPAPVKRFRCDICAKEFSKLCDMERHTRVHTGEKPCECNICHKRFQQSHNLTKHLLTHLHVKPFQCEICNKKFGRIDVLNRHLLIHSMVKPFKCEICPKGFIRQHQYTHHMAKLHPDEEIDLSVSKASENSN